MHIAILGAGVIGTSTAWFLAKEGHSVSVIDRGAQVASETSFANACMICPGHSLVWNKPAAPLDLLRNLLQTDPVSRVKPQLDCNFLAWNLKFLASCSQADFINGSTANLKLGHLSTQHTKRLLDELSLHAFDQRNGLLYLHHNEQARIKELDHLEFLRGQGIEAELLDRAACLEMEPALDHAQSDIHSALWVPSDMSADCQRFSTQLADESKNRHGVDFLFNHEILGARIEQGGIRAVVSDKGDIEADCFVLCLGSYSPLLARELGIQLPIIPVKGYSLTAKAIHQEKMPGLGGLDMDELVAWSPLGDTLRVTSKAELVGFDNTWRAKDFRRIKRVAEKLFPGAADLDSAECWAGLRPMSADGIPVIDAAPGYDNFWLNTGHGYLGWTMAVGSAMVLTALIEGREPAVDAAPYRYRW